MSMTDPISDMLTRIRNAQMVAKKSVMIPASKIKKGLHKNASLYLKSYIYYVILIVKINKHDLISHKKK